MSAIESLNYGLLDSLEAKTAKYWEVAKVNYLNSSVYLLNLVSRSIQVPIRIWIFTQLYYVTYQTFGVTQINGLTVAMVIWILMITQSVQSATRPHVSQIIEEEVKSGVLAYSVNRPYSYTLFHYFGYLGRTVPSLIVNVLIGSITTLILVGPIGFDLNGLILGFVLLFFGITLNFLIYVIIGLSAFWIEDTSAFTWIYSKAQLVFGGLILPLALFPESIKNLAEILPFSQLFYSPAQLIVSFDFSIFFRFLMIQFFWLAFFWLVAYLMFKKGIRYVSVNGG